MLIIVGYLYFTKPTDAELQKERIVQHNDSVKKGLIPNNTLKPTANTVKKDTATANVAADSARLKSPFGAATFGKDQLVNLENKDIAVKISNRGGRVYSVELKNYKTFSKKPLILFDGSKNHFGFVFYAANKKINTDSLYFNNTAGNVKVAASDSSGITLRLSYSPTQYIDYVYSLKGTGYKLDLAVKPTGLDGVIANSGSFNLDWQTSLLKQEKDMKQERQYSTLYYLNADDEDNSLSVSKDEQKEITDKKLNWVAFKQHFFSNVLIAKDGFSHADLAVATDVDDTTDVKEMKANLNVSRNAAGNIPLEFYFGPNRFLTLKAQGHDLDKLVDFGPWGLKYINRFAVLPVFNFLAQFNWNYGLIILVLTVLLKLVLMPLTYKSYLSMAKMRVLKPEMDEIKAKVGEDNPTLLQQEYLKLYKKAGVNPLGGCLPLLIQMPIVIAFFRFFPSLFELRGQGFLWMHDLSTYDSVISFAPVFGVDHISLMCLLMTISTLIYTYFNNQISGATGQMKYIGYITPIIFLVTLNSYPAGLNYYYFLANMFTFAQQYIIRLLVDDKKIHAQIQENKKKPEDPAKKKKAGFQARMEEMMRQQQQLQAKKK
jgi:YidC/Oxa1 family membrane protein insertase